MTESMTTQTQERKYTLKEISSAWYECYGERLEDDYDGFIETLKDSEPVPVTELTYSFQEQLDLHIKDPKEFDNIYPHSDWPLEDYKAMFGWISDRHLVQQEGGIGFVYQDRGDEPCDWCGTHQLSWCQSNGCEKGQRRIEWMKEEGIIKEEWNSETDWDKKETPPCWWHLLKEIEQRRDPPVQEEEEVDSFIYNSYKCKHSDCDYETLNTNPDCIKCGKEFCMLAQSNEGTIEYEIECCYGDDSDGSGVTSEPIKSKEDAMKLFQEEIDTGDYSTIYLNEIQLDKNGDVYSNDEIDRWVNEEEEEEGTINFKEILLKKFLEEQQEEEEEQAWCEVGEHHVDKDEMWPDFGDCQNCCSEKEYLERTGQTKKKKIKFNVIVI